MGHSKGNTNATFRYNKSVVIKWAWRWFYKLNCTLLIVQLQELEIALQHFPQHVAKAVWCSADIHGCVCVRVSLSVCSAMSHAILNNTAKSFDAFSCVKTFTYSTQTRWEAVERERGRGGRFRRSWRERQHIYMKVFELSFWEVHWSRTTPSSLSLFDGKQSYKAIMNN